MLRILILGSAAGGGLPQWNCGCPYCVAAREGSIPPATQSSIAVSRNSETWLVLNASPDIRQQVAASRALHPRGGRGSPIRAVLLTNGDVDHIGGLLALREKTPFTLYGTPAIHQLLRENDIFDVLDPDNVSRRTVFPDEPAEPLPGIGATLFPVPGKSPLYREGENPELRAEGEKTVGVEFREGDMRAFYIPGCAAMTPRLAERLRGADLVLFDGTLWRDEEMIETGAGMKTGARMGHMAMDGPDGSIAAFAELGVARKVFVHINNTNPVLAPAGPERAAAESAGWEIGHDGMEFQL